jgi:hypothetical protein
MRRRWERVGVELTEGKGSEKDRGEWKGEKKMGEYEKKRKVEGRVRRRWWGGG